MRKLFEKISDTEDAPSQMVKPTLLIVDDVSINTALLKAMLGGSCNLIAVDSGKKCLSVLEKDSEIKIILLDINLPDIDGYILCQRIKQLEHHKDTPVIFVTSNGDIESEERAFEIGAVDYIVKPLRPAILRARVATHLTIIEQKEKLKYLALRDPLTGLFNRHHLYSIAGKTLNSAHRYHSPLCAVMLDVDHFKRLNDTHGHDKGDKVLTGVAKCITENIRAHDLAFRYGGEEFLLLFERCEFEDAYGKTDELREKIASLTVDSVSVTISAGVSFYQDEDDLSLLINRADNALYKAKHLGRNRVEKEYVQKRD